MWIQLLKPLLGKQAGERIHVSAEEAKSLISQGFATEVKEDPLAPTLQKGMEDLFGKVNSALQTQLDAALKQFQETQSQSRKHALPAIFGTNNSGDPKKTFGSFLLAIRSHDLKALEEMGSRFVEWDGAAQKTAMSTQTGTTGGFAIPTQFHTQLMQLASEQSIVRPRATIIPMTARTVQVPCLDVTTAPSAGDTAYLGGLVGRWTEEATTLNETEPALKQVELTNYELSGYSKLSNTLLQDNAIGLEAFLMTIFAKAIAWYEDYAFLRGNGVGKPLGVLTWPGLINATRSAASAFALADAAVMLSRLTPGYTAKSTCWCVQPTLYAKLLQMQSTSGPLVFLENARGEPQMTLLGLPVCISEKLPALNTLGDVLLCDFAQYLIGDRRQVEIAYSEHVAFLTNQAVWRFVQRVGGRPWPSSSTTLSDASTTVAPFVGLAAG